MNVKRILALLVLFIMSVSTPFQGFALSTSERSQLSKSVIISKSELGKNLVTGQKYIRAIDRLVEEKKDDKAYLTNLVNKLEERRGDFVGSNDPRSQKIVYVIDYLVAKAKLEIAEEASAIEKIETIDLNSGDKAEVEKRMLALQVNMLESSEDVLSILKKYTSYEQSGSYEMRFNMDEDSFGTLMSEFKIKDYVTKNNLFDSQITGDVEGRLEYAIAGRNMKLEFSSFVDAIIKDDNFYVMLDNVKSIVETEDSEFSSLIDISKRISTEGKYVRIDNENYGDVEISKEMIESFLSVNKYRSLLENPILEAYKVEGDKYYLIPTQSFCSEAKKLFGGILGNIGDGNCSESQYDDMVKGFLKDTNAYMTMDGDTSTIHMEERGGVSSMNMSFDDDSILSANMEIIDNSPYSGESKMTMSYLNGESINMSMNTIGFTGSFNAVLNSDNSLSNFDMVLDGGEDFNMNMNLVNKKLAGNINASSFGERLFSADISGTVEKNYVDMEMVFEFMDFIKRSENNYNGTMNLEADTRNNKNNMDLGIYVDQNNKNIVEFEIISESTIKYGEVDIQAPTDFVEVEEVWNQETFSEIY